MHHLMSAVGKYKDRNISCIPNNMEKYISFSLGNLRLIDSLQFLNASLDTLLSNSAKEGPHKFQQNIFQILFTNAFCYAKVYSLMTSSYLQIAFNRYVYSQKSISTTN